MKRLFQTLLLFVAMSASANDHLERFIGAFEGTFEQRNQHDRGAAWTSAPALFDGRWIVSERYAELRGSLEFAGFDRPIEFVLLWSWDPFQKEHRLAVLDDAFGLLDVFEQTSTAPLTLSNVAHGTYFEDEHGPAFNQVTVHQLEGGAFRMDWAASRDGKKWTDFARVTLKRRAETRTGGFGPEHSLSDAAVSAAR